MSRRPGARFNRGRFLDGAPVTSISQSFSVLIVALSLDPIDITQQVTVSIVASDGGGLPTDPLTIISSRTPFWFFTADQGYVPGTWTDQSSGGFNATQSTGSKQPTLNTAALNTRNTLSFDGVDDVLQLATWNPPAPGTTNMWFFMVFRQRTFTNGDSIFGGGNSSRVRLYQATTSPNLQAINTTNSTAVTTATLNSWFRGEVLFNNATTDYLKVGSTSVTGINLGNTDIAVGAYTIGGTSTAAGFADIEVACIGCWNGEPTAGEKTSLNSWVTSYYGAGVGV